MKQYTEQQIEQIINNVAATLKFENLIMSDESKELSRRFLRNEITQEQVIQEILKIIKNMREEHNANI